MKSAKPNAANTLTANTKGYRKLVLLQLLIMERDRVGASGVDLWQKHVYGAF